MRNRKEFSIFYGWIIVAINFVNMTIVYGMRFSYPVFYVAILHDFGWTRANTAGMYSLSLLFYGLTCPVAGFLLDRFGPRKTISLGAILMAAGMGTCSIANAIWHFYALFGIVTAIGMACTGYVPSTTIITKWFVKRRATAMGLVLAGNGAAYLMGTVAQVFISNFGWRGAYLAFAALPIAIIIPTTILLQKYRPEDMGLIADGYSTKQITDKLNKIPREISGKTVSDTQWVSQEWTLLKAIRTARFWLLFFASFAMFGIGLQVLVTHHVALIVDAGFSEIFAASIHGLFGLLVIAGRLSSFICDRIGREKTYTIGWGGFMLAVSLLFFVSNTLSPWLLYFYAVVLGFSAGIIPIAHVSTIADFFEGRSFGVINGVITLGFGIGGLLGPWLGGYIFDITGSYFIALVLVMFGVSLAVTCIWLAAPRKVRY